MNNLPQNISLPGLYIHIPVCATRCSYCSFCSIASSSQRFIERMVHCICREIERSGTQWSHFDTVYIGGGTPSYLHSDHLRQIMTCIRKRFRLASLTEITMEVNPGDVNPESLDNWIENGVNRISLGVQSLDPDALRLLGRRHSASQNAAAMNLLMKRAESCDNTGKPALTFSFDLIMGIPGQSLHIYEKNLKEVIRYRPHHISCYQLSLEPGTPLSEQVRMRSIQPILPDQEAHLFEITHKTLLQSGYDHYEVSNYSCGCHHYSRHNVKYWFHSPYLGIGPSAHSYDGRSRWWNTDNPEKYCDIIDSDVKPIADHETIDSLMLKNERIFLGLRTKWGIDMNRETFTEQSLSEMQNLIDKGLLIRRDHRVCPTAKGLALADALAERLIGCETVLSPQMEVNSC